MTVIESADPSPRSRPALSPSRAVDFRHCGLKYRLRVIDRIPEAPSRAALRGTVVHATLEDLYALPPGERLPERASALVVGAWDRVREDDVVVDDLDVFLDEVRGLVASYYELEDPTSFDPESCEHRVETELADGTLLRGIVDRIDITADGRVHIVDYKSGRAPSEQREARALFQMKFYALLILRIRGVVPAQLRLLYLADNTVLTYEPDVDELIRFEGTLTALWTAIRSAGESGGFEPNPGPSCGWCDYKPLCPAFGGTPPPYPGWPAEVDDDR